jgi:hypothetical protein
MRALSLPATLLAAFCGFWMARLESGASVVNLAAKFSNDNDRSVRFALEAY